MSPNVELIYLFYQHLPPPNDKKLPTSNWIWATPNDTISFFFFPFLRGAIIGFELNEIREEIMLFILKEYDHWKIRLLEIYGCFSSSSQKEKKNGCLKNMTIGKGKKSMKTK